MKFLFELDYPTDQSHVLNLAWEVSNPALPLRGEHVDIDAEPSHTILHWVIRAKLERSQFISIATAIRTPTITKFDTLYYSALSVKLDVTKTTIHPT